MLPLPAAMFTSNDRALELMRVVTTAKDAPVGQTPKEVVWRKNKARLYRYLRGTPATRRTPIFLCVPLINRSYILDLRPGNSFVEFLLAQGHEVFLIDWGVWGPEDRGVTMTDLVTRYLPRAMRRARELAGEDLTLLGYCIGGVLSTCYAALYREDAWLRNLVLFTTPIDFADAGRFGVWTAKGSFPIDRIRDTLDVVPGELIDAGAKMLDPFGAVGTYLQLAERLKDPAFDRVGWQAMYRWVNEGVPFPAAAYHEWITEFYQENKLITGDLRMDGRAVRLSDITLPLLNVAANADTIAPRPTTSALLGAVGSRDKEEVLVDGGHVGIVVGRTAKTVLWPRVAAWLARHD